MIGRFAPSPTGPLHLGNLRTALVAWLITRSGDGGYLVRMEDLDRVTSSQLHEAEQLASLSSIGLDWDGEVVRQSDRFALYFEAIERLRADGLVYECFCTRREIRLAAEAPHGPDPDGRYPGTCRDLGDRERAALREAGRTPALRLRSDGRDETFADRFQGTYAGRVDDVVLQRNDGVPAYNLAVVVDDADQGVTEVVRGDDLLSSTPSQIMLHRLLDLPIPCYGHIPLVLAPDGSRLAKRHGAVTLDDLAARGKSPGEVCARLAASIGIDASEQPVMAGDLLDRFDPDLLPRTPWQLTADEL
ncbi:MAG TPA: tRNA glutamyl-Q(34) synthetase GluQRS [Ilumatobacteraceae bacterium]|jgi:glutamyl-tRNA synthetase|nr:tRNA glutamyl-Q(34) synthetase GluQRS [Ilumatobacteraceae bacterium]